MLHPVGPLPAAVYWRRRVLVLALLFSVLGGGGWLGWTALREPGWLLRADAGASAAASTPTEPPALEQVVPSLASVQTPTGVRTTPAPSSSRPTPRPTQRRAAAPRPAPAGPCTDDMIGLEVRTPDRVAAGAQVTFEVRVRNTSRVPCLRPVDKELLELVLIDGAGARLWGSNDCLPEQSDERRSLAPGEVVALPLLWSGRTSEPTCTAVRVAPRPGTYVVRGRLDTKTTPDARLAIG